MFFLKLIKSIWKELKVFVGSNLEMSNLFWEFGDKRDSLELVKSRGSLWGVDTGRLVLMDQTHSAQVKVVEQRDVGCGFSKPALPVVDAVCTDMHDILLVVKGADCVPILFHDPVSGAVAAAHSGRKGTQASIAVQVVKSLQEHYQSKPADLQVWVGPGVSGEHYQVSQSVYDEFVQATGVPQPLGRHLDLRAVIVADLLRAGVSQRRLHCNRECTYASDKYFSYRQDKDCGRQLSAIGVLDGTNI